MVGNRHRLDVDWVPRKYFKEEYEPRQRNKTDLRVSSKYFDELLLCRKMRNRYYILLAQQHKLIATNNQHVIETLAQRLLLGLVMAGEVVCIEQETEAWNIDGSSDAQGHSGHSAQYCYARTHSSGTQLEPALNVSTYRLLEAL